MRVDDVDPFAPQHGAQLERRARIELTQRIAEHDVESRIGRAFCQRLAGTRRHDASMAPTRKLRGQPQRLPLAAAPAMLRIDVQNAKSHRAQLPRLGVGAQGSARVTGCVTREIGPRGAYDA